MLNRVKIFISHLIAFLSPKNYVEIINGEYSSDELDEELRRRSGL